MIYDIIATILAVLYLGLPLMCLALLINLIILIILIIKGGK
jgi:hypothetical protein|nr:MAG TPA: hypothetical protein [Caudoviricetes sp.]